ncbi:GH13942 [Drosophila grimshawi]|uniref:GH13942 n=1 Tax=Drosophila grimshawi TaxID=7222 RepID=B4K277_DROGR|nr:GH13942 [Drosophila grimshawi]
MARADKQNVNVNVNASVNVDINVNVSVNCRLSHLSDTRYTIIIARCVHPTIYIHMYIYMYRYMHVYGYNLSSSCEKLQFSN